MIHPGPTITLLFLALIVGACKSDPKPANSDIAYAAAPYDFSAPTSTFEMPPALQEISGLTVLDETRLAAVNDEVGRVYSIGIESGTVKVLLDFGAKGDYEGVERVGERLFVLTSDGKVVEVRNWRGGGPPETDLFDGGYGSKACNSEGLASDGRRLLLVCKEANVKGDNAMYAFDLATDSFAEAPIRYLDPEEVGGRKDLRPSAAAVHPLTGQTVVLSSRYQVLLVLGRTGALEGVWDFVRGQTSAAGGSGVFAERRPIRGE